MLGPGLRAVICGSAAGTASARAGAYYAHPQNKFWPTLCETGAIPERLAPRDFRRVLEFGIGLTDLTKHRHGQDKTLARDADDGARLATKIAAAAPRILAFNGKAAALAAFGAARLDYGWRRERFGGARTIVLPSTSGAASGAWDIAWWRIFAEALNEQRTEESRDGQDR